MLHGSCQSQRACQGYELKIDSLVTAQACVGEGRGHDKALGIRSSVTRRGNIGQNARAVVLLFLGSVMDICLL